MGDSDSDLASAICNNDKKTQHRNGEDFVDSSFQDWPSFLEIMDNSSLSEASNKKRKKRNNAIPANSLVAGSVWKCQGNGNPLKLIKRAFIRDIVSSYRGFTGQTYKICHSGNSKNGLVINCISDGKMPRK